jgi:transposase
MMGQQSRTESLFYYFRLEEQIPTDHLLRMIDGHVDFSFVREQLKNFYSPTGRPSIRKFYCDCCWSAISTGSPANGV